MKFIFDVDGTLTPSRGTMDLGFRAFFNTFALVNDVYLVTGSDRPKTIEQITKPTYNICNRVYNCSGSEVWTKDDLYYASDWKAPKELYDVMTGWLLGSKFPLRTGNHIEERTGMVNFSIIGRNCTKDERKEYVRWDNDNRERETIAHIINSEFNDITATVGGETGIDIAPTGCDKSQIMKDFDADDEIIFFGDRMDEKGNDYPLAKANKRGKNHHVKNWQHTYELLKNI